MKWIFAARLEICLPTDVHPLHTMCILIVDDLFVHFKVFGKERGLYKVPTPTACVHNCGTLHPLPSRLVSDQTLMLRALRSGSSGARVVADTEEGAARELFSDPQDTDLLDLRGL